MFISSFSTYITNNTSDRTTRAKTENIQEKSDLFSSKLSNKINSSSLIKPSIPANYISQGQAQHNKQMIELNQQSIQNSQKSDFKASNDITKNFSSNVSLLNAKAAYSSNVTMFSLLKKPTATLDQTPSIDKALPENIQELKEKNMRHQMVNTYLANDKYYQITA